MDGKSYLPDYRVCRDRGHWFTVGGGSRGWRGEAEGRQSEVTYGKRDSRQIWHVNNLFRKETKQLLRVKYTKHTILPF